MITDEVNALMVYRKLNSGMFLDTLHNRGQTAVEEMRRKAGVPIARDDFAKIKNIHKTLEEFAEKVESARFLAAHLNLNEDGLADASLLTPEVDRVFRVKVGELAEAALKLVLRMQELTSSNNFFANTYFHDWTCMTVGRLFKLTGDPKTEVLLPPPPELIEAKILSFNFLRVKKLSGPQVG